MNKHITVAVTTLRTRVAQCRESWWNHRSITDSIDLRPHDQFCKDCAPILALLAEREDLISNRDRFEQELKGAIHDTNEKIKAEREQAQKRIAELEKDGVRLDWLETRRLTLNGHYGTHYGWKYTESHNVTRVSVAFPSIDLNDVAARAGNIREAIDAAMGKKS